MCEKDTSRRCEILLSELVCVYSYCIVFVQFIKTHESSTLSWNIQEWQHNISTEDRACGPGCLRKILCYSFNSSWAEQLAIQRYKLLYIYKTCLTKNLLDRLFLFLVRRGIIWTIAKLPSMGCTWRTAHWRQLFWESSKDAPYHKKLSIKRLCL